jgi:hypothetical protein
MTHSDKHVYPPALNLQAMHVERKKSFSNADPQALNPKEKKLSEAQFKV